MAVKFLDPGGDATYDTKLFGAGGSSAGCATDYLHGGHIKSYKYTVNGANYSVASNVVTDAGGRISIWVLFHALPTDTRKFFGIEQAGDGLAIANVRLTSGGVLQIWNSNTGQMGSDGSTLSIDTWYRLCFDWTITDTTHNEFRLYKDASLDNSIKF